MARVPQLDEGFFEGKEPGRGSPWEFSSAALSSATSPWSLQGRTTTMSCSAQLL